MAEGVEMSMVAYALVLEIDGAECIALGEDVAATCGVEHRNGVLSAYINGGIHYLTEVVMIESIAVPAGEKQDVSCRIPVDESSAKLTKAQTVVIDSD